MTHHHLYEKPIHLSLPILHHFLCLLDLSIVLQLFRLRYSYFVFIIYHLCLYRFFKCVLHDTSLIFVLEHYSFVIMFFDHLVLWLIDCCCLFRFLVIVLVYWSLWITIDCFIRFILIALDLYVLVVSQQISCFFNRFNPFLVFILGVVIPTHTTNIWNGIV